MILTALGCHLFANARIAHCGDDPCSTPDTALPTIAWDCQLWEEELAGELGVIDDTLSVCGTFEEGEDHEALALSSAQTSTWNATVLVERHYVGEVWLADEGEEAGENLTFHAAGGERVELFLAAESAPLDWLLVLMPSR